MYRRRMTVAIVAMALILGGSAPAWAGHDHYIVTPNGMCHQVARGQTAIDDESHGGFHRFHENVHIGATEGTNRDLGQGNSRVDVYKGSQAPAVCF